MNNRYLRVRDTPFLSNHGELDVNGQTYYLKHDYDDEDTAQKLAREIIDGHKRIGLGEKLNIRLESW